MPLNFHGNLGGPEVLVAAAAPQDLTAAWADLGAELYVQGAQNLGLWLSVDINNSTDVRVRCLAKLEAAGAVEYSLPIRTVGAADVLIEDEYLELNVDADQNLLLGFQLDGLVPVVQFQVMTAVVGVAAGQIDYAAVTAGKY